jgi:CPA2 family monovalent cation:H+ antiporter-2
MLKAANPGEAKTLIVTVPDSIEAGQIVTQARAANPALAIIARASSDAEAAHLGSCGANAVVHGAEKIADAMVAEFTENARRGGT